MLLHPSLPSVPPQICIEMVEAAGVAEVLEKHKTLSKDSFKNLEAW